MPSLVAEDSWAILIGASSFPRDPVNLPELPAVKTNISDLELLLGDSETVGFKTSHIVPMVDQEDQARVGETLAETARKAVDTLLVYYAGHGLLGDKGELRLAMRNTRKSFANVGTLNIDDVLDEIRNSRARKKILILDCCFSGAAINIMSAQVDTIKAKVQGTYALFSSPATKPSIAPEGARYTAFTGALVKVLKEGIDTPDDELTLERIYQQVRFALLDQRMPEPQRVLDATADQFRLAYNKYRQLDLAERVRIVEKLIHNLKSNTEKSDGLVRDLQQQVTELRSHASELSTPRDRDMLDGPDRFAMKNRLLGQLIPALILIVPATLVNTFQIWTWRENMPSDFKLAIIIAIAIPVLIVVAVSTWTVARRITEPPLIYRQILGRLSPTAIFWCSLCALLAIFVLVTTGPIPRPSLR